MKFELTILGVGKSDLYTVTVLYNGTAGNLHQEIQEGDTTLEVATGGSIWLNKENIIAITIEGVN